MKLACIDIGTNSIRLMIADYDGHHFENVTKQLEMTRLGYGVNETKKLDADRMLLSANAIKSYYDIAVAAGAQHIFMMATSAVRDAINSDAFIRMVYEKTGQKLDVISGELEAKVGFQGVLIGSENTNKNANLLIIDIGGGSTELIIGNADGIKFSKSLNMGAVRLTGAFVSHDPVLTEEVEAMRQFALEQLETIADQIKPYEINSAVGIGGTATTVATMIHQIDQYTRENVHQLKVERSDLFEINEKLIAFNNAQRKEMIGLEEKRADIILAGSLILQEILMKLGLNAYSVSDYDNLEGYTAFKFAMLKSQK